MLGVQFAAWLIARLGEGLVLLIVILLVLAFAVKEASVTDQEKKREVPAAMAIMRSVAEIERQGIAPRHRLIREEVLRAKKRGITVVYRSVEDQP